MPPQLFDPGLAGSLAGSDFSLPEMNMDYSSSMPSVQAGDPFSSMYPQSAAYGDIFPDTNAGDYMQNYQPTPEKPDIFKSIIQSAFAGMAAGANSPGGMWGGLGAGFVGAQKYQQSQDQYKIEQERAAADEQRKQEQHEANMGMLNVNKSYIMKQMDHMDEETQNIVADNEREEIKMLSELSKTPGGSVRYLGEADSNDPEAIKKLQSEAMQLTGGKLQVYPSNVEEGKVRVFEIGPGSQLTQPMAVKFLGGQYVIQPGQMTVDQAIQARINSDKNMVDQQRQNQLDEYRDAILGQKALGLGGANLGKDDTQELISLRSNITELNSDIDKKRTEIQKYYEPGDAEYDAGLKELAASQAELNQSLRRQAEVLNQMQIPEIGFKTPLGPVIGYSGAVVLIKDKTGKIIEWDPKQKKAVNRK